MIQNLKPAIISVIKPPKAILLGRKMKRVGAENKKSKNKGIFTINNRINMTFYNTASLGSTFKIEYTPVGYQSA